MTVHREDTPMQLLAEGLPLSLLWDLVDPNGLSSQELFESEG